MVPQGPFPIVAATPATYPAPPAVHEFVAVIITNVSPYTLSIAIGGPQKTLPAYTADLYAVDPGDQIDLDTLTALAGAGTDATLYLDWIQPADQIDQGAYPQTLTSQEIAALVSGQVATNIAQTTLVASQAYSFASGSGASIPVTVPAWALSLGILLTAGTAPNANANKVLASGYVSSTPGYANNHKEWLCNFTGGAPFTLPIGYVDTPTGAQSIDIAMLGTFTGTCVGVITIIAFGAPASELTPALNGNSKPFSVVLNNSSAIIVPVPIGLAFGTAYELDPVISVGAGAATTATLIDVETNTIIYQNTAIGANQDFRVPRFRARGGIQLTSTVAAVMRFSGSYRQVLCTP